MNRQRDGLGRLKVAELSPDMDAGKRAAILAAGGSAALARLIGIKLPPLWRWKRVPAERVLQVEKATGVPRHVLRPDLYPEDADGATTQQRRRQPAE